MKRLIILTLALCAGCVGTAGETDAGMREEDAGVDAGPPPIIYTEFTLRSAGWPTAAVINGAATLDGVLYVSTDRGIYALDETSTQWAPVVIPLIHDAPPTSLSLTNQQLVMTAAGPSLGGLFLRPFDDEWNVAPDSPTTPCWALVQRPGAWLLATTGGLYAAATLNGPWSLRSRPGEPLFSAPLRHLVTAPSAQKLFADGAFDAGLYESVDEGATWARAMNGAVDAIAADGVNVLLSIDGAQQRSDNYGSTFHPANAPVGGVVSQFVFANGRAWAATSSGLFASDDRGVTFSAVTDGLPAGTATRSVWFAGRYAVVDTTTGPWVNQP